MVASSTSPGLLVSMLPDEAPGKTMAYLMSNLRMGSRSVNKIVAYGVSEGILAHCGSGKKGDPNTWYKVPIFNPVLASL